MPTLTSETTSQRRERIALEAMRTMLANPVAQIDLSKDINIELLADYAVSIADAVMRRLA
jgi:hypothetical protein